MRGSIAASVTAANVTTSNVLLRLCMTTNTSLWRYLVFNFPAILFNVLVQGYLLGVEKAIQVQ